ncbi:acyltransferase [Pollutibacter soli]|uniref:acyltransferase family protein n=1 Tax=Pollutibacter soli TaxID=3034157 RepID=UPI00301400CA
MKKIFQIELDRSRKFGLDILRCIAILCVVIEHGGNFIPEKYRHYNEFLYFDGVSIFFVLSGFLIGGILIKLLQKNPVVDSKFLLDFWIRRWFRTIPAYFLVLFILIVLQVLFHRTSHFDSPVAIIYKWFIFSQNLVTPHPWFFPEAWSLCVEEWFYLLIPVIICLLIIFLKIKSRYSVLVTALFILVSITLFRYFRFQEITVANYEEWDIMFRKQVFTRLDSLMYGVIGAYISFYFNPFWKKYKRPMLFVGLILFLGAKYLLPLYTEVNGLYNCVFSFSVVSLGTLCLLPYLSDFKFSNPNAVNGSFYTGITYISLISYSMYLLNYSLIQVWIIDRIPWGSFMSSVALIVTVKYILFWAMVIALSILLYKYFEVPMTKLRDNPRWKKARVKPVINQVS